jgi:hypothetical protein
MLFHRTKAAVTVRSREEEDALGAGWSRTIWPPGAPAPDPAADVQPPPRRMLRSASGVPVADIPATPAPPPLRAKSAKPPNEERRKKYLRETGRKK